VKEADHVILCESSNGDGVAVCFGRKLDEKEVEESGRVEGSAR
jgi:hypothetical protein